MQHILYLTAHSVLLHRLAKRNVTVLGHYSTDDSGLQELRDALEIAGPAHICILADLIEEEFQLVKLPHTLGRDRRRLRLRHEGKLFRGTPFRYSKALGRDNSGRRDDIVSFSALTNRDNLEALLATLEDAGIPLSGICSLPSLTPYMLSPLSARRGNVLVVTEQPDDGLRQTFVCDGKVHFSRLAPIGESSPQQYCALIDAEIHKTRRYLETLKLLPRDSLLDVYTITDSARVQGVQTYCRNEDLIRLHPLRVSDIAAHLGFRSCPDIRYANLLYCHLAGKYRPGNQYAPPVRLRSYNTFRARQAIHAAAWLFTVAGLTWSGINTIDALQMETDTAEIRNTTLQVETRYREATDRLPMQVDDARAMREAVQLAGTLTRNRVDPGQIFARIGSSFARHPGLIMTRFDWQSGSAGEVAVTGTAAHDSRVSAQDPRHIVASISGKLQSFDGNYRQAHASIENLARDLRAQAGVIRVELSRTPLDTRESSEIQGELGGKKSKGSAQFDLELVLEAAAHGPV